MSDWTNIRMIRQHHTMPTDANLEPSHVEKELQDGEEWDEEVDAVTIVVLQRVQELTSKQTADEEGVHSQRCHLKKVKLGYIISLA